MTSLLQSWEVSLQTWTLPQGDRALTLTSKDSSALSRGQVSRDPEEVPGLSETPQVTKDVEEPPPVCLDSKGAG